MASYNIRDTINWSKVHENDTLYIESKAPSDIVDNQFNLAMPKGTFKFTCIGSPGKYLGSGTLFGEAGAGAKVTATLQTNPITIYGMCGYFGYRSGSADSIKLTNGAGFLDSSHTEGSGGGATHIATSYKDDGVLTAYENYQTDILIVAGGGGGGSGVNKSMNGGDGGTPNGGDGIPKKSGYAAKGGTQSSGGAGGGYSGYVGYSGSFGKGGGAKRYSTQLTYSGSGGGGFYGGGGGGYRNSFLSAGDGSSGGGGGSSYVKSTLTDISYSTWRSDDDGGSVSIVCTKLGDYSITENLTNCSLSFSGVPYFWSGESKTITIVKNEGYYTWDRAVVSVTVGGVDVTSSVYNPTTHIITLTNITANVVINALCYSYPTVPLNDKCSAVGTYSITATSNSNRPQYTESNKSVSTAFYSVTKPTVSGATSWTYDGSSHGPTIVNPNPAHATKSGTFSATDAGSYYCMWVLDNDTTWSDKSYRDYYIDWDITKASNTLTASKSSVSIAVGSSTTVSLSATYSGDGFGYSGEGSVATISVSGSTMTITGATAATITLSVYAKSGTNYEQSNTVSISVTVTE